MEFRVHHIRSNSFCTKAHFFLHIGRESIFIMLREIFQELVVKMSPHDNRQKLVNIQQQAGAGALFFIDGIYPNNHHRHNNRKLLTAAVVFHLSSTAYITTNNNIYVYLAIKASIPTHTKWHPSFFIIWGSRNSGQKKNGAAYKKRIQYSLI